MFLLQNPRGKAVRGIARLNGHFGTPQHLATVKGRSHQMHRAASLFITCSEGAGVGIEAFVFGQKRGVDIEHLALPFGDKLRAEHPHEPSQTDDIRGMREEVPVQRILKFGAAAVSTMINHESGNAPRGGFGQPASLGIVGPDHNSARRVIASHRVNQPLHIRAAARNQDGDP